MSSAQTSILDQIGRTPLVPLNRLSAGLNMQVFGKCEHLNPGGSVKDRIALAIINDAEARGILAPGGTLIEATAGNTGIGLALVAAVRGYQLVCVMPEKMSQDKRIALATLGARIVITPNAPPHDPKNFRNVARRLAEENGWFSPISSLIRRTSACTKKPRGGRSSNKLRAASARSSPAPAREAQSLEPVDSSSDTFP